MSPGELEVLADVRVEAYYIHVLDSLAFRRIIVKKHGLGPPTLQSAPSTQRNLRHYMVCEYCGCPYTSIVKFAFRLNFELVSSSRYLL